MSLLALVRHGITDQTGKRLYGRRAGVHLSDRGREQAREAADRLAPLRPAAVYSSPLERCMETAEPIARACRREVVELPEVLEVDYGAWAGRSFPALRRTALWRRVHTEPSAVRFPDGESLVETQRRAVEALREAAGRHGRGAVVVVTHGDVIRLAVAHFVGMHMDLYHRLEVGPGSVTVVALDRGGPRLLRLGDTGRLDDPAARPRRS
jgi:probable phosphomutase (TIGR03848 family)